MRKAFTMMELIFVIAVVGILTAIAIPKLSATRDDARISKMGYAIATTATEVVAYVVARGDVNATLSEMSNNIRYMLQSGDASEPGGLDLTVDFKMGTENNCIRMQVVEGPTDANLTVTLNDASADPLCDRLQEMFDTKAYPIALKGQKVVH